MSFENTECPCGGTKAPGTMLCKDCLEFFKRREEMRVLNDSREPRHFRAQAAQILCHLARKRRQMLEPV